MTTYVFTDGGLINKATGEFEPFNRNGPVTRPQIMRGDEQEPLVSMADGKVYTSKAAMRESYKASGNPQGIEYTEVGDDTSYRKTVTTPKKIDEQALRDATERAYADLNAGRLGE